MTTAYTPSVKAQAQTTVSIRQDVVPQGNSILLTGTVNDVSAGTKDPDIAARFPSGVPAMSDESQSDWMQYVYMQFERPTDATGVNVTLSVLDPNGNMYEIGTTQSDVNGFYKLAWTPEISGEYTVIANFAGSESYWPSHGTTAFSIYDASTPQPTPTATAPAAPTEMYIIGSTVAIIIAIAIVGLLMLRKRP